MLKDCSPRSLRVAMRQVKSTSSCLGAAALCDKCGETPHTLIWQLAAKIPTALYWPLGKQQ